MLFLYTPRNFFFVLFPNPLMTDRLVGFMLSWAASFHRWWRPILVAIKLPGKSVAGPCIFQGNGIIYIYIYVYIYICIYIYICHFNSSCHLQKFSSQTGLDVENLCLDSRHHFEGRQLRSNMAIGLFPHGAGSIDQGGYLWQPALRKRKTRPRDFSGHDSLGKWQTSSPTKPKKGTEKLTNITRHDRKKMGKPSPSHHKHVITDDDWGCQAMQGKKHHLRIGVWNRSSVDAHHQSRSWFFLDSPDGLYSSSITVRAAIARLAAPAPLNKFLEAQLMRLYHGSE